MQVHQIISELDRQISQLKEARGLLAAEGSASVRRGRPPKKSGVTAPRRKRRLTPEGRKRISEALKRRWAARRTAQAKTAKK